MLIHYTVLSCVVAPIYRGPAPPANCKQLHFRFGVKVRGHSRGERDWDDPRGVDEFKRETRPEPVHVHSAKGKRIPQFRSRQRQAVSTRALL